MRSMVKIATYIFIFHKIEKYFEKSGSKYQLFQLISIGLKFFLLEDENQNQDSWIKLWHLNLYNLISSVSTKNQTIKNKKKYQ